MVKEQDPVQLSPFCVSLDVILSFSSAGSHGFKPLDSNYTRVFQSAQNIHMVHTLALLSAPFWKNKPLTGSLFVAGIILFSGSCYVSALTEHRAYSSMLQISSSSL